jgi:hypothetical protein
VVAPARAAAAAWVPAPSPPRSRSRKPCRTSPRTARESRSSGTYARARSRMTCRTSQRPGSRYRSSSRLGMPSLQDTACRSRSTVLLARWRGAAEKGPVLNLLRIRRMARMRLGALAAALSCVALIGCAEKSDSQQATDAVKAKISQRGEPVQIGCKRHALPGLWSCLATLRHDRMKHAVCGVLEETPEGSVASCRFFRRPPTKKHKALVIR